MRKNLPSIVTGLVLVIFLGLYMVTYQVRFTEVGVLRTFGRATQRDVITEPGLYWKWPWPIQAVDIYDARLHVTDTHTEQTATRDKKPVIVTSFVTWRIQDPYQFRTRFRSGVDMAELRLRDVVETLQKAVLGEYYFSQLINKNTKELQFDQIEEKLQHEVASAVDNEYGIEVAALRIRQLSLPEDVTQSVFESMRAERRALAQRYESEGESEAANIVATANSQANTILSFANRLAERYRAEGNARAAEYYKMLHEDAGLAMFLDRLRSLKELLKDKTTIAVTWNDYPFTEFRDEGRKVGTTTQPADIESSMLSGRPGGAATE